ncbi:MAG: DUF502 domain-containing protein [Gemmataceae bacterium]|nr:DUF502 domain-containing protein [Gemmataceae bacterium]
MKRLLIHLRNKLLAGVLAAPPLLLLVYAFFLIEHTLQPLLEPALGARILGLPLLVLLVLLYLLGVLVTAILAWRLRPLRDRWQERLQGLGVLYQTCKDVVVPAARTGSFQRVVLVSLPDDKTAQVGFTSGEALPDDPAHCRVFLPGIPNPLAGRLAVVACERCVPLSLSVAEVFRSLLSAGNSLLTDLQTQAAAPLPGKNP